MAKADSEKITKVNAPPPTKAVVDDALREAATGPEVIKENLKRLPSKPGVYRMIGKDGEILYVGKAKSLKNRVSSYTKIGGQTQRIALMISKTAAMEFVVTDSETEALLLEANLIKRLKPRFNIILRDDKSFPYILLRRDHDAPQVLKHRGSKKIKGDYFGPFASAGAVDQTIDTLQKAFLLRTCSDSTYDGRTRPCMLHQIKRCSAPCVDLISLSDYQALAEQAGDFLKGKAGDLQSQLSADMAKASEDMEFERAAHLRDRIKSLTAVRAGQDVNPHGIDEADVFACEIKGGLSCVQVFFFRAGQNWGNRAYYPRHDANTEPAEILDAFIAQFYDARPPAKLIITSHRPPNYELIAEALGQKIDRKVTLLTPQKGEKKEIVEAVRLNAKEALSRKLAETASTAKSLKDVGSAFGLEDPPQRIEIYDNSHIQGSNMVGGMVVAGPEGFEKNQYRKYNIKSEDIEAGDDYGMMREVFSRRFGRLLKEREETGTRPPEWPDLVLIDGGKGQLSSVIEAITELGLSTKDVNLVAIAKGPDRHAGREQFFMPGKAPFQMPINSPTLYYLQRLRDEAHRWAIGAHRSKRKADIKKNPLDEIAGIGPSRKKALLHHFGSAKGVAEAKLSELKAAPGISKAVAEKVYGHFRGS